MTRIYRDIENIEVEIYAEVKIVDNGVLSKESDCCIEVQEVGFVSYGYSFSFKSKILTYIEANEDKIKQELEENY